MRKHDHIAQRQQRQVNGSSRQWGMARHGRSFWLPGEYGWPRKHFKPASIIKAVNEKAWLNGTKPPSNRDPDQFQAFLASSRYTKQRRLVFINRRLVHNHFLHIGRRWAVRTSCRSAIAPEWNADPARPSCAPVLSSQSPSEPRTNLQFAPSIEPTAWCIA
jgi:hypothetical protein